MADERLCSIPGCDKHHLAKGWCPAHYTRWHRYGDPMALAPARHERLCSIEGCGAKHEAQGFCNKHYKSFRTHGDPLKSEQWGKQIICSIGSCGRKHYAHGLCAMHNWRHRKHGAPLAGRTFNGEAWRFFREVVLNFKSDECLIWPFARNEHGYGVMAKHGENRTHLVHRLACETIHGHPPSQAHQAAHSCGQGHAGCCNPTHCRWATQSENEADKVQHGTRRRSFKG